MVKTLRPVVGDRRPSQIPVSTKWTPTNPELWSMARPRTPSNVLELRGAFDKNPQRRREDLPGVGAFNPLPPTTLHNSIVPYWHEIVSQINPVVLTASDHSAVKVMARLLHDFELTGDKSIATELRQMFSQFGMTPAGRAKLSPPKKPGGGNKFADT